MRKILMGLMFAAMAQAGLGAAFAEESLDQVRMRARAAYEAGQWAEALASYQRVLWDSPLESDRSEAEARMRVIARRIREGGKIPAAPLPAKPVEPAPAPDQAAPPAPTPPAVPAEPKAPLVAPEASPAVPPPSPSDPPDPAPVEAQPPAVPAEPSPSPAEAPVAERPMTARDCLQAFRMGDAEASLRARAFLREHGAEVLPEIRSGLADVSPILRRECCLALGRLRDADSTAALRDLLKDGTSAVREAAAQALGRMGDAESVPELAAILRDVRRQASLVRASAADALGFLDAPESKAALVQALRGDPSRDVRGAALHALERLTGGIDRCYDPSADGRNREGATRSWEEWLEDAP